MVAMAKVWLPSTKQAADDFDDIKDAIEYHDINVGSKPTSKYGDLVRSIVTSAGPTVPLPASQGFALDDWETVKKVSDWVVANPRLATDQDINPYRIGDSRNIEIGGMLYPCVIWGFNHDDSALSLNKAGITIGMWPNLLDTLYPMAIGTSNSQGWDRGPFRLIEVPKYYASLEVDLRNIITPVLKRTTLGNQSTAVVVTEDTLWVPSVAEVSARMSTALPVPEGNLYEFWFRRNGAGSDGARIMFFQGDPSQYWWRVPNIGAAHSFMRASVAGAVGNAASNNMLGVGLGFCI